MLIFYVHYIQKSIRIVWISGLIFFFHLPEFSQIDTLVYGISDTLKINEIIVTDQSRLSIRGLLTGKLNMDPSSLATIPSLLGNTDVLKLLELTPGVQTAGDANTNMYIRGGEPGQNLLLYNGATVYTPGHLLGFFSLFNADHLSSLEMSKGGGDSGYGGRLSSTIDIRSKTAVPKVLSIRGNMGLLSSQFTLAVPFGPSWGLYISGRKTYIDLLMQPVLNATINHNATNRVDDTKYDFYDGNLTFIGEVTKNDKLIIDAFTGNDKLSIADEDILLDGDLKWYNRTLSAQWIKLLPEQKTLEQTFFYSKYKNTMYSSQAGMHIDLYSSVSDIGYKNKYSFGVYDTPVETGFSYIYHTLQPQTTRLVNLDTEDIARPFAADYTHDISGYLQTRMNLSERLAAEGGIRFNLYVNKTKTYYTAEPRLHLRYRLDDNTFLRTTYSRTNQYISMLTGSSVGIPTDFWISAGKNSQPQSGDEISIGGYKVFSDGMFEISTDVYFRNMRKLNEYNMNFIENIYYSPDDVLYTGKGRAYGWELMIKKNYGKISGWMAYTLGRSERKFREINDGKIFPARFDRRHDISLVTTYTLNPSWDFSFSYIYATGNAYTLPTSWYFINNTPVKVYGDYNGSRMPDYNRTDISVNYWYKKDNGINFSVYNLFMVTNPVYIFLDLKRDEDTGDVKVLVKQKKLATIIPSISWRFKF